jgi:hypothetical protein
MRIAKEDARFDRGSIAIDKRDVCRSERDIGVNRARRKEEPEA